MSCFRPISAYRVRASGELRIGYDKPGGNSDRLELPCSRCIGCKLDRARMWSIRLTHEAQLFDSNLFVTLTYDDGCIPADLSLDYRDFQSFLKRLRKRREGVGIAPNGRRPIRFFCAGEYGGKTGRPHFHAILFNARFGDEVPFQNGTLRSALAEDLWQKGHVVVGSVTPASAAYVAGYTVKKVYGQAAKDYYEDVVNLRTGELSARRPEFVVMSRRPGIGAWWYERFRGDVFPGDAAVHDGRPFKVPRYYWERFRREADPGLVEEIAHSRYERAMEHPEESSVERRAVREEVAEARVALFAERAL